MGAVDRARVALADEVGQVAAVIDMCVAEDDSADLPRIKRELAIAPVGFRAAALKQSAVE